MMRNSNKVKLLPVFILFLAIGCQKEVSVNSDNTSLNISVQSISLYNIGELHNKLVIDYIEHGSFNATANEILNYFVSKVDPIEVINVDLSGFDNLYSIHELNNIGDIWIPEDAGLAEKEREYVHEMVGIINNLDDVQSINGQFDDLLFRIFQSDLNESQKQILYIGINIGRSSYYLWAPKSLGGLGYEKILKDHVGKDEIELRDFGEWFAKTATADIIGGLTAAARSAYLAVQPQLWLANGLISGAVSSTVTGIMAASSP